MEDASPGNIGLILFQKKSDFVLVLFSGKDKMTLVFVGKCSIECVQGPSPGNMCLIQDLSTSAFFNRGEGGEK